MLNRSAMILAYVRKQACLKLKRHATSSWRMEGQIIDLLGRPQNRSTFSLTDQKNQAHHAATRLRGDA